MCLGVDYDANVRMCARRLRGWCQCGQMYAVMCGYAHKKEPHGVNVRLLKED